MYLQMKIKSVRKFPYQKKQIICFGKYLYPLFECTLVGMDTMVDDTMIPWLMTPCLCLCALIFFNSKSTLSDCFHIEMLFGICERKAGK